MVINAELLSPAGSFSGLRAAITNGADAVYLGIGEMNARANAENFTIESLKEAVRLANIFGVKVYLTMNTLLKSEEVSYALTLAKTAWDIGVSAIIVQDLNLCFAIKKKYSDIVLHASTQMAVHNLDGAQIAATLGMDRVILSRETPLKEIRRISQNCTIELEYFVHGALCCGFSGICYFSSLVSGKSGNRGRCLQLCRKPYILDDCGTKKQGYWLSVKDTMLINDLKRLVDAGICSFKIEGRMRRQEYAAEVTRVYRKAMNGNISDNDIEDLKLMFNRGDFSRAHLDGIDSSIVHPFIQNHVGIHYGYVNQIIGTKAILNTPVSKGDGIKFVRKGREVGHALAISDGTEIGFVGNIKRGDELRLTDSARKNSEINSRIRRIPIDMTITLDKESLSARILQGSPKKEYLFSYPLTVESAKSHPTTVDSVEECFTALGNTFFECRGFSAFVPSNIFLPKSQLKQIRRNLVSDLENALASSFERHSAKNIHFDSFFWEGLSLLETRDDCVMVRCTEEDAAEVGKITDYVVIAPRDYADLLKKINNKQFISNKEKYILDLPPVSFENDLQILQKIIDVDAFDKFMINNIYGLRFGKKHKIIMGYKMNVLDGLSGVAKIASIERNHSKLIDSEEFVFCFGRPEIMHYVHCYYKINRGCLKCVDNNDLTLIDDRNEQYTIKRTKIYNCYNSLISCRIINLTTDTLKKRFIDIVNLTEKEKNAVIYYLNGNTSNIMSENINIRPKNLA